LYLRLGEASGSVAADTSGHGRSGSYSSGITVGRTGALWGDADTAAEFQHGSVSIPDGTGLPHGDMSRTMEAWVKGTDNGTERLLSWGDGDGPRRALVIDVDRHNIYMELGGLEYDAFPVNQNILDGEWHQVAVTYDGTVAVAYLDGQKVGQDGFNGALAT